MLRATTILLLVLPACFATPIKPRALNDNNCGKSDVTFSDDPDSKIVGGTAASKGQYPWMISVQPYGIYHMCGASIIDDYWVMTAAHCLPSTSASYYTLVAGAYDITQNELQSKEYSVEKVIPHPNYNSWRITNDIGLFKLKKPIDIDSSAYMNRVCLADDGLNTDNMDATIVGWGDMKNVTGQNMPDKLQHAEIVIKDEDHCEGKWGGSYSHSTQVCAQSSTTAVCSGDSGGPIMVKNSQGAFVQVGISSFVYSGGCLSSYPVVFTRVSAFRDWIEETMRNN